jgi:hypothetical protein
MACRFPSSPRGCGHAVSCERSARSGEHREESGLRAGILRDRHLGGESVGAAEGIQLRLDDLLVRLHQLRIQRIVLPARYREVPAMDQHVQETVPGLDRAGHGSV